jgi:hypothetical protein
VADLAMGSAHFLVAAVDRIESKMRSFLAQPGNAIAGVSNELERLAEAARKALGEDLVAIDDIDEAVLLRRQIARRCVYGIDVNPLAVELSRLALWIHTFVPGLPMSTLDHNLVCANSLTGISSIEEAEKALELGGNESQLSLFESVISGALREAHSLLVEWSDASEATQAEVHRAYELAKAAEEKTRPVKAMLDVALASIAGVVDKKQILEPSQLSALAESDAVKNLIASVNPAHMPFLFPEVFVRDNPGFDAILGNPPWETLAPDERKFWAMKFPGFMGLPVADRERAIRAYRSSRPDLVAELARIEGGLILQRDTVRSKYPINKARPDLSEMFAWTYLQLLRSRGHLGVVLPRTALTSKALSQWRKSMLELGGFTSLVTATNSGKWLFDIHPQYTVALCSYRKEPKLPTRLAGPFSSKDSFLRERSTTAVFENPVLLAFTETHSFPSVGNEQTAELIGIIRNAPSLVEWRGIGIRSVQEFNATTDRPFFESESPLEPVPVISGRGFDLWEPDTGSVFARAERATVHAELTSRLSNQVKLRSSAFHGLKWPEDFGGKLPYERARVALRNLTNPTNRRTIIAVLLPPLRILPNTAPYLFLRPGSERAEALLVGALSSIPLDWYARKFVESSLMTHLLHALPIPDFSSKIIEERTVFLAGSLAAADEGFLDWAEALDVPVGSLKDSSEKEEAIFELDALVSLAYGLERDHVQHIFETFHRGWDYAPRLARVLEFYDEWKAKA